MDEKTRYVYERIKYFKNINPNILQSLILLGFSKKEIINKNGISIEIYTRENFVFPYFISEFSTPSNMLCAIFRDKKEFIVYGSYENLNKAKEILIEFSQIFHIREKKKFGIPLTLTEENAQDYGYIRGLIVGVFLMLSDFLYSFFFKLKTGIITGFIDYVKVIYHGTPGFGLFVGITGTGLYFIFLLILIPILFGTYYKKVGVKKIYRKVEKILNRLFNLDFDYGIDAERAIQDELELLIEEKRKLCIYNEIVKEIKIEKEDFLTVYEKIKSGFFKLQDFLEFLILYEKKFNHFPLLKLLKIILKYENARISSDIKFEFTQENL